MSLISNVFKTAFSKQKKSSSILGKRFSIFVFLLGSLFVFAKTHTISNRNSHLSDIKKFKNFSINKNQIPTKIGAPIFVQVEKINTNSSNEFNGLIHLQRYDINEIYYSWILPNGSSLQSGSLSGSLPFSHGSSGTLSIPIQVENLDKNSNQNVILTAWVIINGEKLGSSGNVATIPEETYENEVTQMQSRSISSVSNSKFKKLTSENSNPRLTAQDRKIQF